jgi:hypothetical protein
MSPQDHAMYRKLADELEELEVRKADIQATIDKLRKRRAALLREKMTEVEG